MVGARLSKRMWYDRRLSRDEVEEGREIEKSQLAL